MAPNRARWCRSCAGLMLFNTGEIMRLGFVEQSIATAKIAVANRPSSSAEAGRALESLSHLEARGGESAPGSRVRLACSGLLGGMYGGYSSKRPGSSTPPNRNSRDGSSSGSPSPRPRRNTLGEHFYGSWNDAGPSKQLSETYERAAFDRMLEESQEKSEDMLSRAAISARGPGVYSEYRPPSLPNARARLSRTHDQDEDGFWVRRQPSERSASGTGGCGSSMTRCFPFVRAASERSGTSSQKSEHQRSRSGREGGGATSFSYSESAPCGPESSPNSGGNSSEHS